MLTTGEWISVTIAAAAVLAVIVAAWQLRLGIVGLGRGSQPVVIVHEVRAQLSTEGHDSLIEYDVYLQNHGIGTAFNARFGVNLGGVSYAYVFGKEDARGARQLVEPGARVPKKGEFRLRPSWAPFFLGDGNVDTDRAYWARYENAFGETWETQHPANPERDLTIKRLKRREVRSRESSETRSRKTAEERATETWRAGVEELRRGLDEEN